MHETGFGYCVQRETLRQIGKMLTLRILSGREGARGDFGWLVQRVRTRSIEVAVRKECVGLSLDMRIAWVFAERN